jgi:hypothetical protein
VQVLGQVRHRGRRHLTRHAREPRRDLGLFNNTAKPSRVAPVLLQMINAPYTGAVIRIDPIGHYLAATRPSQGTAT